MLKPSSQLIVPAPLSRLFHCNHDNEQTRIGLYDLAHAIGDIVITT